MTATNRPPNRTFGTLPGGGCIGGRGLAGGLAAVGGTLALLVHPWFAAVAAVGGIWLIFAPESTGCRA